jgi:Ca2+-binding EF-hand superfamily protein
LPPEFVHGGGGIMDFESDDPDFAGAVSKKEQLFALKRQIKRELLTKAKNMREMFRRMGGAGDGEVDEYEFKAALRNNNIGVGHEAIMGVLFRQIDADNSGHIDFKEFAKNLNGNEEKQEGNFFIGGGRNHKRFIPQVMKTCIGLKRTWEILKTKIEQRCKSSSSGTFAMTSPHVLAKMFHEFDTDGGGSLSRKEFERALREKLGMMMISQKDLDLLTDQFDSDGDGEITYEEFISKVMPPEITHGGGGILDFPCDDPASKGSSTDQLNRLRKEIKNKLSTNSKNMRVAFRKMGGAGDGKVDKYEFMTYLRNLDVGAGQPKLVEHLFAEIDDDHSGHLTFAEFSAGIEHPKTTDIDVKIERHIPMGYLRVPTPIGNQKQANPQDDPRSEDIRSQASSAARTEISNNLPKRQNVVKSKEAKQRLQRHINWQRPGARPIPVVFAKAPVKRTTMAQQRAADLRRSQGRHPINMMRATSMRPASAYIANRPKSGGVTRRKKRPASGRRLKNPRAVTIQAAAARAGGHRWKDSLKKSNFFRSAPVHKRRYGAANTRARLQEQLQEKVNYTSGRGLILSGDKKLNLTKLLGINL